MKSIIILSDGTELSSGVGTVNAIQSVAVTHETNSDQNITVGSTCSSMVEATIITPGGGLSLTAGEEITLYKEQEDGQRKKIGVYILEKPTKTNADAMKITAFDMITKLDKDMTLWFAGLDEWPYTLFDMASMICTECGLTLENEDLPNGDFYVQQFFADGITGRDLIRWIGQVAGRFCIATPDGNACFGWYKENAKNIGTDLWYYQGGLSFEDYTVQKIEKVQIRNTSDDIGTFYPDVEGNTYVIEGNPMLSALDAETLLPVAQTLYEQLKDVSYTPCNISIPATLDINAGDIVSVKDTNGKQFKAYIMSKKSTSDRDSLESRGTESRESTLVVSNQTIRQYMGKVLNLSMTVDGIKAENKDMQGNLASLKLDLSGIDGRVEQNTKDAETLKTDVAEMKLAADSLQLSFQNIVDNGTAKVTTSTGYTLDADGLKIKKSGQQMENKLDDTGMVVTRNDTPILKATAEGVEATDVRVNNYLIVGNCRFEDYTNGTDSRRTACFFTGEGG